MRFINLYVCSNITLAVIAAPYFFNSKFTTKNIIKNTIISASILIPMFHRFYDYSNRVTNEIRILLPLASIAITEIGERVFHRVYGRTINDSNNSSG